MMKKLNAILFSLFLVFAIQSAAVAQSINLTETFKKNFNETVQEVQVTEDATRKRTLLNESFTKMITAIERIESKAKLSQKEIAELNSYKADIQDKRSELNGTDGFNRVVDKDLNNFTYYSQQSFEQADKTITIGVTVALLVVIILLLL